MPAWLDNAIFYEIYPQSFQDTNADGIGDLRGIINRLDYIRDLGCNAIWLNPCFDSPFTDAGYDVPITKGSSPLWYQRGFEGAVPRSSQPRAPRNLRPSAWAYLRAASLVFGINEVPAQ